MNGIMLTDSDDNTSAGNRVDGGGAHGLLIRSGSDNNAIRGDEFDSNDSRGIAVSLHGGLGAPETNTRGATLRATCCSN